jgi:hypothetical protein
MAKTNKALQVRALVYRPQGVTHKEVKAALGWPSVHASRARIAMTRFALALAALVFGGDAPAYRGGGYVPR